MKVVSKIFIGLDIARSSIFILLYNYWKSWFSFPFFILIYLITAIIIDITAIRKLDKVTKNSDLTAIGILSLIFGNLLGGIFILCVSNKDLSENRLNSNTEDLSDTIKIKDPPDISAEADKYFEELNDLKYLLDNGLITKEEYNEKREKYIGLI